MRDRSSHRMDGWAASLAGLAFAALAVVLLVAVRIAPFLAIHAGAGEAGTAPLQQPCC